MLQRTGVSEQKVLYDKSNSEPAAPCRSSGLADAVYAIATLAVIDHAIPEGQRVRPIHRVMGPSFTSSRPYGTNRPVATRAGSA